MRRRMISSAAPGSSSRFGSLRLGLCWLKTTDHFDTRICKHPYCFGSTAARSARSDRLRGRRDAVGFGSRIWTAYLGVQPAGSASLARRFPRVCTWKVLLLPSSLLGTWAKVRAAPLNSGWVAKCPYTSCQCCSKGSATTRIRLSVKVASLSESCYLLMSLSLSSSSTGHDAIGVGMSAPSALFPRACKSFDRRAAESHPCTKAFSLKIFQELHGIQLPTLQPRSNPSTEGVGTFLLPISDDCCPWRRQPKQN